MFTQYEGERKGTMVKALISTVNSNNLSNTDRIVTVVKDSKEASSESELNSMISEIETGMTYNITFEYENGIITRVVIG